MHIERVRRDLHQLLKSNAGSLAPANAAESRASARFA
jgi:hypothetical protein